MAAIQADLLQGPGIDISRLQGNTNRALAQVGIIAKGQLAKNVTIAVPPGLPAQVQVPNPLGRSPNGAFVVQRNQAISVEYQSGDSKTLTFLVTLEVTAVNGIITGLSGLKGSVVVSIWVF